MKAIGFKNFRRFENFPTMELGDITMLVGGNNSGKSTVVKAILLVHHFLQTKVSEMSAMASLNHPVFTFDVPNVNIGTFTNAYNRKSAQAIVPNYTIELSCQIGTFEFTVEITDHSSWNKEANSLCDLQQIQIKDKETSVSFIFDFKNQRMSFGVEKKSLPAAEYNDILEDISFIENIAIPDKKKEIENCTDLDEILLLKDDLEDLELSLKDARTKVLESRTSGQISTDLTISSYSQQDYYVISLLREFLELVDRPLPAYLDKRNKEYKTILADRAFIQSHISLIEASIRNLSNILAAPIEIISAHVARQTIFFKASDKNDYMAQAIHEFAKLRINPWDGESLFVDTWLHKFDIADEFRILSHGGEAYEIRMFDDESISEIRGFSNSDITIAERALSNMPSAHQEDNVKSEQILWEKGEPLGSKGMGAIQIAILLLQLATYMRKYKYSLVKPLIMIEEPEQNLHPRFQSILADLFLEVSRQEGFSFLIETHSEYLIRKSQVIWAGVAKAKTKLPIPNPFKVYYLSSKDLPYQMIYKDSGDFENEFEEGFFDEATNLIYQIL